MSVYKDTGVRLPVRRNEAGVPVCPCCDEPMVEVDPGFWQCAFFVEMSERVRRLFIEAFESVSVEPGADV